MRGELHFKKGYRREKMKNFKRTTFYALVALMSIAFVQTTIAGVTFSGSGLGQITGGVPGVSLTGIASGTATHLGKYTRTENLVFGPGGTFTGDVTFLSADGQT